MILCICRAVSDRVVRLAVMQGARSVEDVREACGAGGGCGACHEAIADVVAEANNAGPHCVRSAGRIGSGDSTSEGAP